MRLRQAHAQRMIAPHSSPPPLPRLDAVEHVDVTLIGERTCHRAVQAAEPKRKLWTEDTPICPVLARHHILHLGIVEAYPPYRFIRRSTLALEMMVCFEGEGRILIDGEWVRFGPRTAALLPQNGAIGYHASGPGPWKLVWVCYQWPAEQTPLLAPGSPVLAANDPVPLIHAVEGLRHECLLERPDLACMEHWVELIHRLVLRFAQPWQREDRLHLLWEKVAASLGEEWTLGRLASEAGCCGEALRRRCQQQIGRSPMQHLTYLRLQRAAELLTATDDKLESIASEVGYGDAFAFSAMFKKWTGIPPREFREQRRRS